MTTEANDRVSLKADVIKVLGDLRDFYGTHHHHKETMAWAGVVFYSAVVFGMLSSSGDAIRSAGSYTALSFATAFLGILGILILSYVNEQLRLRSADADIVHACHILILKLLQGEGELAPKDLEPHPEERCLRTLQGWHFLPRIVLEQLVKPPVVEEKGTARLKLEGFLRVLILLVMIASLAYIWSPAAQPGLPSRVVPEVRHQREPLIQGDDHVSPASKETEALESEGGLLRPPQGQAEEHPDE